MNSIDKNEINRYIKNDSSSYIIYTLDGKSVATTSRRSIAVRLVCDLRKRGIQAYMEKLGGMKNAMESEKD